MSTVGVGPQNVQLTVVERTKTGRRKNNQDAALRVEVVPGRVYLVGVADGMGGYAGGEQASAAALKHIQLFGEMLRAHLPDDDKAALRFIRGRIEGLYADIQREIQSIATADPNLSNMGTTLVLAAVCGRFFFVANIGDSRAYLLYRDSNGRDVFRQITEDHSVANDARRAGTQVALDTPEAQRLGKALTRALRPNTPFTPELFPSDDADAPGYVGNDGDTLLISSDGMYGSVSDDEMEVILVESSSLQLALERLEEKAYNNESADNITTVAVDFGPRDPRRKSARRSVVAVTDTMLAGDLTAPRPESVGTNGFASPVVVPPVPEAPRRAVPLAAILIGSALLLGAGAFGVSAALRQAEPKTPTPTATPLAPLPTPVPDRVVPQRTATPGKGPDDVHSATPDPGRHAASERAPAATVPNGVAPRPSPPPPRRPSPRPPTKRPVRPDIAGGGKAGEISSELKDLGRKPASPGTAKPKSTTPPPGPPSHAGGGSNSAGKIE